MHLIRPVRQTSRAGTAPGPTPRTAAELAPRRSPVPQRTVDVPTAVAAVQNEKFPKNKKQQDAYFAVEDLAGVTSCAALRGLGCYGVADGHGEHGEHVAAAVCTKLPEQLAAAGLADLERGDLPAALRAAFCAVDADLRAGEPWSTTLHKSGCTFCCVLVTPEQMHVAWAGDCAAVLVSEDGQEALTQDHRVGAREDEHQRVLAAGAVVEKMADNKKRWGLPGGPGFLEATRAFGDWWGKQEMEAGKATALTAEPEVRSLKRGPEQRYLAIGSDGVFGFIGASEVAACLRVPIGRATPNLQSRVNHVLEVALAKGSNDNCCLVATDLRYKRDGAVKRTMLTNAKSPEKTKLDLPKAPLQAANRSDSPPRSPKSPKSAALGRELRELPPTSPTKPDAMVPRKGPPAGTPRDAKKGPVRDTSQKKLLTPVRKASEEELSPPKKETQLKKETPAKKSENTPTPSKRVPVDRSQRKLSGTKGQDEGNNSPAPPPPVVPPAPEDNTAAEVAAVKTAEAAKMRAELEAVRAELAAAVQFAKDQAKAARGAEEARDTAQAAAEAARSEAAAAHEEAAAAKTEAAGARDEAAAAKQDAAAAKFEAAATKQEAASAAQELAAVGFGRGGKAAERQQALAATNAELKQLAQDQVAEATARAEAAEAKAAQFELSLAEAKQETADLAQQVRDSGGLAARAAQQLRETEEELRGETERAAAAHAEALAAAQEDARQAAQTAADEATQREEALLAEVEAAAGAAQKAMHAAQAQGEHDDQVRNELQRQAQQSAAQAAAYLEKATKQEEALRQEMEAQAGELDRLRSVEADLRAKLAGNGDAAATDVTSLHAQLATAEARAEEAEAREGVAEARAEEAEARATAVAAETAAAAAAAGGTLRQDSAESARPRKDSVESSASAPCDADRARTPDLRERLDSLAAAEAELSALSAKVTLLRSRAEKEETGESPRQKLAAAQAAREKHPIVPVSIATPPATLKDPGSPVLMPADISPPREIIPRKGVGSVKEISPRGVERMQSAPGQLSPVAPDPYRVTVQVVRRAPETVEIVVPSLNADGMLGLTVDGVPGGLQVTKVAGKAAQAAGFKEGDKIVKADGAPAHALKALRAAVGRIREGHGVVFLVERAGDEGHSSPPPEHPSTPGMSETPSPQRFHWDTSAYAALGGSPPGVPSTYKSGVQSVPYPMFYAAGPFNPYGVMTPRTGFGNEQRAPGTNSFAGFGQVDRLVSAPQWASQPIERMMSVPWSNSVSPVKGGLSGSLAAGTAVAARSAASEEGMLLNPPVPSASASESAYPGMQRRTSFPGGGRTRSRSP